MADISKIKTPDGTEYNVKDTTARSGLSGKQATITASGVLIGNGSGGVTAKTLDTSSLTNDNNHVPTSGIVKSALDALTISFTVTLAAASWSSNAQTVNNANFVASGYAYVVSPASASFSAYASAQIYADDVTTDGSMTFHCATTPSSDLTVNILREAAT